MKKCVFAGSFDPPTVGHKRVVEECLQIFDCVTVALLVNTEKAGMFTKEERLDLLNKLFAGNPCVKVIDFDGAAVDLLKQEGTKFYVRGVRDGIDVEYENRNAYASEKLMPEMINVYLPARQSEMHISSSLVRNSIIFGKDYSDYIPSEIAESVKKLTERKNVRKTD